MSISTAYLEPTMSEEFYLLYALVVTFFSPDAIQGERIVTQPLSYHATELLCDQAKDRWVKMTAALYPEREPNYILKCDPPTYYGFDAAVGTFGPVEIWQGGGR